MATSGPGQGPDPAGHENLETLPEGSMIGEFEITGLIGEGGFGTVYLAVDHSLQRKVALKEYRPAALSTRQGQSVVVRSQRHAEAFEAGLKSFLNEARTLARFDHPSLVRVYRVWQENSTAYMAMALCEGRPLTGIVRDHRDQVTEAWLKSMLGPLLEAVDTLHSVQIYHRDIAPDNVLIQDNGLPVLLDFGAARHIATGMTQALTVILKPGYAPIEQFAEDPSMKQGPWTDIYALGAVMHYAVTGRAPPNSVARLVNDPLKPMASTVTGEFSPEFLGAIDAALSVRPEGRPQNIAELRALLGMPVFAPPVRSQTQPGLAPGMTSTTVTMIRPRPTPPGTPPPAPAADGDTGATVMIPRKTTVAPAAAKPAPRTSPPAADDTAATVLIPNPAKTAAPAARTPTPPPAAAATSAAVPPAAATPPPAGEVKPAGSRKAPLMIGVAATVVLVAVGAYFARNASSPTGANTGTTQTTTAAGAGSVATPAADAKGGTAAKDAIAGKDAAATKDATASGTPSAVPAAGQPGATDKPAAVATGSIRVAVKPWGEVMVDGVSKGVSPPLKLLKDIPEGKHQVEVTNPGFPPYSVEVEVAKKQPVTVSYEFK